MLNLKTILSKTQLELKQLLHKELKALGYKPVNRPGFLYAEGTIPVLLVAHLDTVHTRPVHTICTSADGNILMSPEGIGGDDRAGVYMILRLLREHRCHVLFCEDEEVGGVGAEAFAASGISPTINYIIELDRRGANDAVFYDCDNREFADFVCSFGFEERIGSFSDISVIAPALEVAAVNLSAGYHSEHTLHEHINLAHINRNIERVEQMLSTPTEKFDYVPAYWDWEGWPLSPLPHGAYLRDQKGNLREGADNMYVDPYGFVFLGVGYNSAIELEGYEAFTAQDVPVHYNEDSAQLMEVIT